MRKTFTILLSAMSLLIFLASCGGRSNGSSCSANADCDSDNCVIRGAPDGGGVCCVPGGCP